MQIKSWGPYISRIGPKNLFVKLAANSKEEHNVHRIKANQVIKSNTTIPDPEIILKINPLMNFREQFATTSLNIGYMPKHYQ